MVRNALTLVAALLVFGCSERRPAGAPPAASSSEPLVVGVGPQPSASATAQPSASALPQPSAAPDDVAESAPVGSEQGACPSVVAAHRRIAENALESARGERAMAEAIRLRLDQLFRHGCHRRLDRAALRARLLELLPNADKEEQQSLYVERVGDEHVLVGHGDISTAWVALYGWRKGKIRSLIVMHGTATRTADPMDAMLTQLLPLDYAVFRPSGAAQPLLVMINTHPWVSSCWRSLRFRVLAPSGDPFRPNALLDYKGSGRWCETPKVTIAGDVVHFDYQDWGGSWSAGPVWRPYRMSYAYRGSQLHEQFGFAPGGDGKQVFVYLIEDWIMRSWALAREATMPAARPKLEAVHKKLRGMAQRQRGATGGGENAVHSSDLFPVSKSERRVAFYCTTEAKKPCSHWPKQVDFLVERDGDVWRVKDATVR